MKCKYCHKQLTRFKPSLTCAACMYDRRLVVRRFKTYKKVFSKVHDELTLTPTQRINSELKGGLTCQLIQQQ